jgi:hypothetical protein
MRIDVRYRHSGDRDWFIGCSENISRGGILVRTRQLTIPPHTPIEVLLALPPEAGGAEDTPVIGRGVVVRSEPPPDGTAEAAAITEDLAAYVPGTDPRRI